MDATRAIGSQRLREIVHRSRATGTLGDGPRYITWRIRFGGDTRLALKIERTPKGLF